MTTDKSADALPPMPSNVAHVMRRIRRCETEAAAQVVLEHFAIQYATSALALRPVEQHEAAPAERRAVLTTEDVERQYRAGVHIGSGLPRATCPCGFCTKHRHGFNRGDEAIRPEPRTEGEAVYRFGNDGVCRIQAAPLEGTGNGADEQADAWINYPVKTVNGEFAGYEKPELGFTRLAYGYDISKAEPLFRKSRAPRTEVAGAVQPSIEYRYEGGTFWCDLGPAERMRPDFKGVYRLKAGEFPVWGGDEPSADAAAAPADVTCARMGHGVVSIADCFNPGLQEPGLIFMELPEPREIGLDTGDVFPEGARAPADKTLAYVSFANGAAVDQTIAVLQRIKVKHFGAAPADERAAFAINPLQLRWIKDHIRDAYDAGYNDARRNSAVSGDAAPGYRGRDIETSGGNRLAEILARSGSIAAAASQPAAAAGKEAAFQSRVQPWMLACFGAEIAGDRIERNHRFLEEALELVQACGCTASEAHQLVDYTFGRPVGEPAQEAGGVMVTLAALCLANSLDMHAAGETELARVWTKVEQIRAKQAAKPKNSPLPEAAAPAQVATWQELTDGQRGVLTYVNQPDNVGAWRLGEACRAARAGGDPIDHGLSLLKELQDRGYGVIALLKGDKQ